jgi:YD repeat-containing protein
VLLQASRSARFSSFSHGLRGENEGMGNCRHDATRTPFGLRALAFAFPFVVLLLAIGLRSTAAEAAVVCPNPVPVVNENQCKTGTTSWQLSAEPSPNLGGYTTQTSVDLGESVTLKIGRDAPVSSNKTVDIAVYRMGYYAGDGGRLVNSATKVAINNDFTCKPMNETTGEVDCGNWSPTYTIPGSALPASGVYIVKLTASTGEQTQVVFTVRDDERQPTSKILFVLPISTYEAYNIFGGKSLYYGVEGGNTVSGTSRAVKVSFNRPFDRAGGEHDWFFGPDFNLLMWMEKQGYDVSYTDDVHLHEDPASLLEHNTVVVSGHSEYWSLQQFKGFLAAREAGINIASFSANTAYWKVRYEDSQRTLVCYKTVEGSGSAGSGSVGQNDWGPDGIKGTADDALGLDGIAGTADDNPQNSTTTFRDNGAPPGDPTAPPGGRVGPDMPENQLFGIMYVGDNDARGFPITVPPSNANEEFAGDRIWRNTGISENNTTNIGSLLVNWEWDAIPTQAQYLSHEPSGVKRLYSTNVQAAPDNSWIQDEGRLRNTTPPPGQPGTIGGVRYTAASGAQVFAAGTMQWSRGLSNETDERIQQATYNIFSDMGEQPNTPEEITLDPGGSNQAPNGAFTISQNPAKTSTAITFNAAISNDPDGTIAKYEWDLDGDGSFETNTGTKSSVTHSFAAEGTYNVRLRVTDNGGATDLAVRTITIIDNQPPTASFTATPNVTKKGEPIAFSGAASSDPDGTIAKYEWDFDGDGSYETNGGASPAISHTYATPGTYTVGLRVTDNGGKTATTTRPVSINSGEISKYSDSVLATPGLDHYWRMGETTGPTFADSKGSSPATASGGTIFGVPGGVPEDPDRAAEFDGVNDAASAAVNLSSTHTVTVEFWLKWDEYANDDRLAMELTGNFNEVAGGFLVDPNAPQLGGSFGVGIGSGPARNNVFFERPSAGTWHHYAFVLNTAAPASQQIIPYVDGKAIAYTKLDSGTGSGNFANSSLFMMSRSGTGLFGAGDLDEVAIYKRALTAPTIAKHYAGVVVSGDEGSVGSGEESGGGEGPPVEEEGPGPGGTGPSYTDAVLASPGLLDYWGMGEASGPTIADSVGSSPATASGGAGFGASGGVPGETGSSVKFDGVDDAASAPLHLSGRTAITVEFWMKWNTWANDDSLAMEYTPNFNSSAGGFLVDPNSSYGNFAVALGIGSSRNVALFARPSAGTWHHYAFVLNTTAPATEEIIPYVDGLPVSYTNAEKGTGAGSFADSTLSFMSRAGSSLFGAGNLQDVAIFDHALSGATISGHYASNGASGRPVASFKAPTTAKVGETVQFDASASKDLDGTIAKYEWDLDGNGSYETDTGTTPSASRSYASAGSVNVGLRVTDNSGNTSNAARTLSVESSGGAGPADYKDAVLGTAGLVDYWRLDEASGSVFADSAGSSPASMLGAPALGVPGGVPGDSDTAARFNGSGDSASAALQLAGKTAITVEFWLKWNTYANDDSLAMEYTPNSNEVPGGFIVDPNSSYGSFAVGLGQGSSRNIALFARPSAGTWHHYAFVLDTTEPANEEVIPYVDGKAVAYTKAENGSGAPAFANAALTFMSRAGSGLFGAGDLDDVSIYDRPLSATTISDHYQGIAGNQRPSASFQAPASVKIGEKAQFDASASSDPDGTVTRYEWDLDGNGSYETSTGSTPSASRSYATAGPVQVGLRVTDDSGATAIASRTVTVQAGEGGGGEEETGGGSSTAYRDGVLGTPSLLHYWRLGEKSGSQLADSGGASPLSALGEPTLGVPGAIASDPDTAVRFDGVNDAATVPLQLSGKTAITVEFWLKWNTYANDDSLAMEYTPNFNEVPGGFIVDPNSSYGSFAVGLGQGSSRNVALFARPSAGTWHHYSFVLDTTAPASEEVVPYVDGKAVAYTKAENGSGAPAFADAALSLMSRAGTALFGAGALDDVAIYGSALSAATIGSHFDLGAPNHLPSASFNAAPNPAATNATVNFNAGASSDSDGTIAKYEWDLDGNGSYETDSGTSATTSHSYATAGDRTVGLRVTDNRGGTATAAVTLTVQNQAPTASFTATPNPAPTGSSVTLDATASTDPDGTIAKYEWDLDGNGSYETSTGTTATAATSFATQGSRAIGLRVTDNSGATATTTRTVTIQNRAPVPAFTATPNPVVSGQSVTFNAATSSDPDGTVTKYEWDLDSNGSYETSTGTTATVSRTFTTPGDRVIGLRVTDNSGATATTTQTVTVQNRVPTASFTATPTTALTGVAIAFNASASSDPDGTIAKYEWDFDGNGSYETDAGATASTSHAFPAAGTITVGLRVTDNSGATATTTRTVTIQNSPPTASFTATPNPVPTGTSVAYDAGVSSDPDGTITKYEWDLDGNGTYETDTGTTASASSSYATVGARTVRLRVTDNSGATTIATQTVTVTNRAPVPSFTISANPVQSLVNVTLNASASKDPDGTIAKYEWDLDGNGSYEINAGSSSSTTRSFATSGERMVGLRVTDNLGETATTTVKVNVTNRAPTASFTASPSSVPTGTNTTLSAAASSDPDGTIAKYEWDLDNNGSYETSGGATSSLVTSFATAGTKTVGLRVTDNSGATATTTRTVTVTNRAPTATFTASPNPVAVGATVSFNAGASSDPDGTITKYEWDLDGNGTYETSTGTTATTTKTFTPAGTKTIGLRVTDNSGATGTTTQTVTVRGPYNTAVSSTPGLIDYWRLGETSGSTLANSVAGAPSATTGNSPTLGIAGPLSVDSNTAIAFNGTNEDAAASLNLSSTSTLTLEFWLKWTTFTNNDDLAFEFTSNFNNTNGGFLVNPNSSTSGGKFEVALGRGTSRNNAYFTRPSAGTWHHYAIVLNPTAAAAQQIAVYVDGSPVSITKGSSGTGAGNFANSALNFMSRNGSSLFGGGSLDEVAIYNQALTATQVSQHFAAK